MIKSLPVSLEREERLPCLLPGASAATRRCAALQKALKSAPQMPRVLLLGLSGVSLPNKEENFKPLK